MNKPSCPEVQVKPHSAKELNEPVRIKEYLINALRCYNLNIVIPTESPPVRQTTLSDGGFREVHQEDAQRAIPDRIDYYLIYKVPKFTSLSDLANLHDRTT